MDPNTPSTVPSTQIRAALSSSPPVTPESDSNPNPSEQLDFENDRARRSWQAAIRDEQEYHGWQHHVLIRRMTREEGLARIERNERLIRELLAGQQEAYERSVKAPTAAPASTPARAPVASVPRGTNTISLGKRKRDTDDKKEEDAEVEDQRSGTTTRTSPMRENTVPELWAGRLRPRTVKKEEAKRGNGGQDQSKSGGRPKKKKDKK